jgi:hypothetical protein
MRALLLALIASILFPLAARAGEIDSDFIKSVQRGDMESARFFILAGADVNAISEKGETALMLARKGGHEEAVAALKEAGARELFFAPIDEPGEEIGSPEREFASRSALEVQDAFAPYTPEEWIVSPLEEPEGDIPAGTTPPESDIRGVLSCFDGIHLRVDILLHHEVSSDKTVGFGVKLAFEGGVSEYLTYFPGLNRLYYVRETLGRIQKSHRLTGDRSSDSAGFSGRDVYLLIEKNAHMAGEKGRSYRVGAVFYSMTLDRTLNGRLEDLTVAVNLRYTR